MSEDGALSVFHFAGILAVFVIIAEKMQEAVHDKMREMVGERPMGLARLAPDGLIRNHDVTEVIVPMVMEGIARLVR